MWTANTAEHHSQKSWKISMNCELYTLHYKLLNEKMSRVLNLKGAFVKEFMVCRNIWTTKMNRKDSIGMKGPAQRHHGVWCFVDATQPGLILKPCISSFLGRCYKHTHLGGDHVAHSSVWQSVKTCLWKYVIFLHTQHTIYGSFLMRA